ncbi:protein dispatched-like [Sitophilus oryzae]|uniref:Protein dispatched-like n=1 Tax=Sitophilus oryzae TaxID=7048 RepID=A0A6J2XZY2_SITOR|nr:protein dispatched-like [Sitophilus oryzae]
MNYQTWYTNFLIKHPYIVLLAISVFSCTCLTLPFTVKKIALPKFQDPQMGFSTRGTLISNRLTTWQNLEEECRPSGYLTKNPKEYLMHKNMNNSFLNEPRIKTEGRRKNKNSRDRLFGQNNYVEYEPKNETVYGKVITNEKNATETTKFGLDYLQNLTNKNNKHRVYEKHFCGPPDEKYVHIVVSTVNNQDLFTWEHIKSLCTLENSLMNLKNVPSLCISNSGICCRPWTLPNYIAALHNRKNCLNIQESDVNKTKGILERCAQYFHSNELYMSCFRKRDCEVPLECLKFDAVYNILNFLTSVSFLPPEDNKNEGHILKETIIFLPIAASSASVPLYHELENVKKDFEGLSIVAVDFGIKSVIFDEYLLRDTWLMGMGIVFIFICIWIYTASLFLTIMTIIAIVFTMAITYFLYDVVYEISFFPFMNMLTLIICIGIGADDTFIFCKIWQVNKKDQANENNISVIMSKTFYHAFTSMFVSMLTTAVAFWGSYVSCVTAISCFSIFAGTAIIVNFFLMVTWFPAGIVIWEQFCVSRLVCRCYFVAALGQFMCCFKSRWNLSPTFCKCLSAAWKGKKQFLTKTIINLKYFWTLLFTILALASTVVVFVYPRLRLPNSRDFQLFSSDHLFEKYDFMYKDKFWFKRDKGEWVNDYKLPLRFVFGVKSVDNGNHLNPSDLGVVEYDLNFDMADPESQEWLRNFCLNLRQQSFYQPVIGISLTSCFIETFAKSMTRKCIDDFTQRDRSPCCDVSEFPFNRTVFNTCIMDEMAEVYGGPADITYPKTAGVMFSKENVPTIKAVVVEFDSNISFSLSYEDVKQFYNTVDSWTKEELSTAPDSMKNGFFVSDLHFYDLQNELGRGTKISIFVSMALAAAVLFISTLNPLISILAIITITFSIIITIAGLVLCGWTLNILESVTVSTAIGLAVDFSLHYSVNYKLCPPNKAKNREEATVYALSHLMGPCFMAALTTAAAGFFMMFSLILPYYQIGLFMILVMAVSWIYATFFLGALFATVGPIKNTCQYTYKGIIHSFFGNSRTEQTRRNNIEVMTSTSSNQDLDSVSFLKRDTPKPVKKKSFREPQVKYTPHQGLTDQSPSSNITIIMTDDN